MRNVALLVTGALLAAALLPGSAGAATRDCAEVSYTPGSSVASGSYGADQIKATDTSCTTARALARRAKNSPPFSSRRFRCTKRRTGRFINRWTCTRSGPRARVTFRTVGSA